MKTLTLEHLSAYLPYEVIVNTLEWNRLISEHLKFQLPLTCHLIETRDNYIEFKPVLYPLSSLTETIWFEGKEIIPMVELAKIAGLCTEKYDLSKYDNGNYTLYGIRCNI
jgi:hypothetical protein